MSNKLIQVHTSEVSGMVYDNEVAREVERTNEPVYLTSSNISSIGEEDDELVKIEVAVRKCKRVGVFDD